MYDDAIRCCGVRRTQRQTCRLLTRTCAGGRARMSVFYLLVGVALTLFAARQWLAWRYRLYYQVGKQAHWVWKRNCPSWAVTLDRWIAVAASILLVAFITWFLYYLSLRIALRQKLP